MAMSRDSRKPASWKNPKATGNGPAPSQKRDWHPPTAKADKPAGPRRRSLLLPSLAGAVLLGLIVAAILLIRPGKHPNLRIVAPANGSTLALPHGVAHAGGAKALVAWLKDGKDRPHLGSEPVEAVSGDEWARGL